MYSLNEILEYLNWSNPPTPEEFKSIFWAESNGKTWVVDVVDYTGNLPGDFFNKESERLREIEILELYEDGDQILRLKFIDGWKPEFIGYLYFSYKPNFHPYQLEIYYG